MMAAAQPGSGEQTCTPAIRLRLTSHGGLYAWEFQKNGRELRVRVEGQLVFGTAALILHAAVAEFGLAYLPADQVAARLADGQLARAGLGRRSAVPSAEIAARLPDPDLKTALRASVRTFPRWLRTDWIIWIGAMTGWRKN
jgi:hypothetical protein